MPGSEPAKMPMPLFFAVYLLAEKEEKAAFQPLCRLMQGGMALYDVIGDGVTEGLANLLVNLYDGDLALLKTASALSAALSRSCPTGTRFPSSGGRIWPDGRPGRLRRRNPSPRTAEIARRVGNLPAEIVALSSDHSGMPDVVIFDRELFESYTPPTPDQVEAPHPPETGRGRYSHHWFGFDAREWCRQAPDRMLDFPGYQGYGFRPAD